MKFNKRRKREIPRWPSKELHRLSTKLSFIYKNPRLNNKDDPLDELIFIVLSNKTTEKSYIKIYDILKKTYPKWSDILEKSSSKRLLKILKPGGLAKKKGRWLRQILMKISEDNGDVDLSFLTDHSIKESEKYLCSFPGIGLKSARCILMYSLHKDVFPVDTHCNRILTRLGVIQNRRLTNIVQSKIQEKIPPNIRYSLHVNLVAHGRAICNARYPLCKICQIHEMCVMGKKFRKIG